MALTTHSYRFAKEEDGISPTRFQGVFRLYLLSLLEQLTQSAHASGLTQLIAAIKSWTRSEENWPAATWLLSHVSAQATLASPATRTLLAEGLWEICTTLEQPVPQSHIDECFYKVLQRIQLQLGEAKPSNEKQADQAVSSAQELRQLVLRAVDVSGTNMQADELEPLGGDGDASGSSDGDSDDDSDGDSDGDSSDYNHYDEAAFELIDFEAMVADHESEVYYSADETPSDAKLSVSSAESTSDASAATLHARQSEGSFS